MPARTAANAGAGARHATLGLKLIERGCLSANRAVFCAGVRASASVVNTGFNGHAGQTLALLDDALAAATLARDDHVAVPPQAQ
jgi:hypothetical protein